MPPETAHPPDVTHAGELVHLDYDLWAEGGGRTDLIDTTREDVAQKAQVPASEGRTWGPQPHLIGGEYFPSGIEAALTGIPVGEEVVREFAPAEAFGERDPDLIELFSMHEISRLPEMRRENAHLDVGTVLTIEGRRGRVVSMTAARVRVDFNPPFAGRKVKGTFRVVDRITKPAEQVRGIVDLQYGRGSEFHIETDGKTITLRIPDRSKFDIAWMAAKPRVIDRLRTTLHPTTIRIVEEYATPAPEKAPKPEETKTQEAPAPASATGAAKAENVEPPRASETTAPASPSPKASKGGHARAPKST